MPSELVRDGEIRKPASLAQPGARIVEFSGEEIHQKAGEVFARLSAQAEVLLIRQLPEVLHVRELFLNFIRKHYGDETALKARITLFERQGPSDEHTVAAFAAAARYLRDTGAMSALFGRLIHSFNLPTPVNIDCSYFRLVLPNNLFSRMDVRRDLAHHDDWNYISPFDGPEPIFARGSAMPHRDLSGPHYAFQINLWFPLTDLSETESLMFFPEAYYNYKERIEKLLGRPTKGFVDDVRQVGTQISANPDPPGWGFGEPAARKMDFGDIYIFYCQQVHASPVRRADTLRLSVEIRVACRSLDDNTGYRRIFSSLNNYLPTDDSNDDCSPIGTIKRADAVANLTDTDPAACAQLYLNSLFATPVAARKAKELAQHPDMFDLGPRVTSSVLKDVATRSDQFPFAEDRYVLLARLFLRRGEDKEAAAVIAGASEQSRSYFWQLQFAHLAIRGFRKELARIALGRCRSLAEQCPLDAFPFAPKLETPNLPILTMLPEHALRAVAAISESIEGLPDNGYGPTAWYSRDPRLFHPHRYLIRTQQRADFHKAGSLFVAIPTGHPFVPEEIVSGTLKKICFGETLAELEFEYWSREASFPAVATKTLTALPSHAAPLEAAQEPIWNALERLKALESTVEERTNRLLALEQTMEERSRRLAKLEAAPQRRAAYWVGSLLRRRAFFSQG
jgi:hypothetical protein